MALRELHDLLERAFSLAGESSQKPNFDAHGVLFPQEYYNMVRRSGTERAANGEAVVPIVVVGRIDAAGAVEVEVVGVAAVRVRSR